jgi:predicted HAD superfamily phosphohydrolase YqeG
MCWCDPVRVPSRRIADLDDVIVWLAQLHARAVVFDIEPLVAYWNTGQDTLRRGVDAVLGRVSSVPDVEVVGFTTNSPRRLSLDREYAGAEVFYLSDALKPFRTGRYRGLPRPAVLVGDQTATDGVLAWRLGFAFAQVTPPASIPLGPRLMNLLGRPLAPLLFHRGDESGSSPASR